MTSRLGIFYVHNGSVKQQPIMYNTKL